MTILIAYCDEVDVERRKFYAQAYARISVPWDDLSTFLHCPR
jgi:hypothetical protein